MLELNEWVKNKQANLNQKPKKPYVGDDVYNQRQVLEKRAVERLAKRGITDPRIEVPLRYRNEELYIQARKYDALMAKELEGIKVINRAQEGYELGKRAMVNGLNKGFESY